MKLALLNSRQVRMSKRKRIQEDTVLSVGSMLLTFRQTCHRCILECSALRPPSVFVGVGKHIKHATGICVVVGAVKDEMLDHNTRIDHKMPRRAGDSSGLGDFHFHNSKRSQGHGFKNRLEGSAPVKIKLDAKMPS
jgi:hypothetical protein